MQHRDAKKGNIHIIHNFEFENIEEMNSYVGSEEDLNKICLLLEPYGFYALKNIEPIEWKPLSTITINLEDYSVYSKEENNILLNKKSDIYNISGIEYECGYTRGEKQVYGIEVDFGALPNATTKTIPIPNFNENYNYWIDEKNSYTGNSTTRSPVNRSASSATANNQFFTILASGEIKITTLINVTTYTTTKIVLNYTKG